MSKSTVLVIILTLLFCLIGVLISFPQTEQLGYLFIAACLVTICHFVLTKIRERPTTPEVSSSHTDYMAPTKPTQSKRRKKKKGKTRVSDGYGSRKGSKLCPDTIEGIIEASTELEPQIEPEEPSVEHSENPDCSDGFFSKFWGSSDGCSSDSSSSDSSSGGGGGGDGGGGGGD